MTSMDGSCEALAFPEVVFDNVILIPAYKESPEFVYRFLQRFGNANVLLIVIVNQPQMDPDDGPQRFLVDDIRRSGESEWQNINLQLFSFPSHLSSLLLVDRFDSDKRIPNIQGVGLARKIGADLAAALIHCQRVNSSQIYSTDADAHLPEHYFSYSELRQGSSAGVFDFTHLASGNNKVDEATKLYEKRLHYYVDGLKYAGSPYAFHTIGSCLTIDMLAYCQVRGFPKKSGGEDFYLLNKLAKLGGVQKLIPCIHINSRLSDRVPFGTGPAVSQIVSQRLDENAYKVYHPQIFVTLKDVLARLDALSSGRLNLEEFRLSLDSTSRIFFKENNFFEQFAKWITQYSSKQLVSVIRDWFDAFRTLKFVHFHRDAELDEISLAKAKQIESELWK